MTRQRRLILEQLRRCGGHPTADELYARVSESLPRISLGTIYRNLDILVRAGVIRRLCIGGKQGRYDAGLGEHYHARCNECGRLIDIPADSFPDLDAIARASSEFEILGHQLAFDGLCEDCRGKQETAAQGTRETEHGT